MVSTRKVKVPAKISFNTQAEMRSALATMCEACLMTPEEAAGLALGKLLREFESEGQITLPAAQSVGAFGSTEGDACDNASRSRSRVRANGHRLTVELTERQLEALSANAAILRADPADLLVGAALGGMTLFDSNDAYRFYSESIRVFAHGKAVPRCAIDTQHFDLEHEGRTEASAMQCGASERLEAP